VAEGAPELREPGRNFFVFTRGRKHQETISLTARMLARMCESNRCAPSSTPT
jgi:hypothetical protein